MRTRGKMRENERWPQHRGLGHVETVSLEFSLGLLVDVGGFVLGPYSTEFPDAPAGCCTPTTECSGIVGEGLPA